MKAEFEISVVYFPAKHELELTWRDLETNKYAGITVKVTKQQGESVSDVVPPCVYVKAVTKKGKCDACELEEKDET
jgi:hypothetical protein